MLRDEPIALDYLASRPEVDPNRAGTQGMSMGSARAWWLAVIDDRIQAVVAVACFTRHEDLISRVYKLYGKPDVSRSVIYPETGHVYNDDEKQKMVDPLNRHLAGGQS